MKRYTYIGNTIIKDTEDTLDYLKMGTKDWCTKKFVKIHGKFKKDKKLFHSAAQTFRGFE